MQTKWEVASERSVDQMFWQVLIERFEQQS